MRLVPAGVVVAVMVGSVLLASGVAGANPPPGTLGFLTIDPLSGDDTARMHTTTSAPCPSDPGTADLMIVGPVGADGKAPDTATFPSGNPFRVVSLQGVQFSATMPFIQEFELTLREAARQRQRPIQAGEYDLTTTCYDDLGIEAKGTFTAGLIFDANLHYTAIGAATTPTPTPSPGATPTPTPAVTPSPSPGATPTPTPAVTPSPSPGVTPTPTPAVTPSPSPGVTPTPTPTPGATPAPGVTPTTITLQAFPRPALEGLPVILLARVSPGNADGSVQFKDGTTDIGEPVSVFNGFAVKFATGLNEGSHELTAEFTPDDPTAYSPSSDSESLTVRSLFGWLFNFRR